MALTATQVTLAKRLHSNDYLEDVTNFGTGSTPSGVDEDVLETIFDATEYWFARRGYDLDPTGVELISWIDLFAKPRHAWGDRETQRYQEAVEAYPHRVIANARGTAVAAGATGDKRHFTDDDLDNLDLIRWRATQGALRGNS